MSVMSVALLFALLCAAVAVIYGGVSIQWILGRPSGNDRMREISAAIQQGASAYLNRQYTTIAVVGVVLFAIIGFALHSWVTAMMPRDFITADGFHITDKCRTYLAPLIAGEDYPPYKNGLPAYVKLKNVAVPKKLEAEFKI